jgi:hypothetical protein
LFNGKLFWLLLFMNEMHISMYINEKLQFC